MREVPDEPPVEVGEPKKGLQLLLGRRDQPLCDASNFGWVHLDRIVRDDHSEVLHPGPFKLAIVRLQVELVLL